MRRHDGSAVMRSSKPWFPTETLWSVVSVARRLEELPLVSSRFSAGDLSLDQVESISKLASPETEHALAVSRWSTGSGAVTTPTPTKTGPHRSSTSEAGPPTGSANTVRHRPRRVTRRNGRNPAPAHRKKPYSNPYSRTYVLTGIDSRGLSKISSDISEYLVSRYLVPGTRYLELGEEKRRFLVIVEKAVDQLPRRTAISTPSTARPVPPMSTWSAVIRPGSQRRAIASSV